MGAIQAARMGDAVGAHASHFWGWVGMAAGILLGAALGAVLIVATGGMAAPALMAALLMVSAVSGAVALSAGGGAWLGRFAHSFDKPPPPEGASPCGTITIGLASVKIEGELAARMSDPTTHNGSMLRQGSKTVLMKGKNATRYKDLSSCSGMVIKAASNTFLGGEPADNGASTGDGSVFDSVLDALQKEAEIAEKISFWSGIAAIAVGASLGGLALLLGKSMPAILMKSLPLLVREGEVYVVKESAAVTGMEALKAATSMAKWQLGFEVAGNYGVTPILGGIGNDIDGSGPGVITSVANSFRHTFGGKEEAKKLDEEEEEEQKDLVGHRMHNFLAGGSSFLMAFIGHKAGEIGFERGEHAARHGSGGGGTPPAVDPVTPPTHPCATCAGDAPVDALAPHASPPPDPPPPPPPPGGGGGAAGDGGGPPPGPPPGPAPENAGPANDTRAPGAGPADPPAPRPSTPETTTPPTTKTEGTPPGTPGNDNATPPETTPKVDPPKPEPEVEDETNKTDGKGKTPAPETVEAPAGGAGETPPEQAPTPPKEKCPTCEGADDSPKASDLADEASKKTPPAVDPAPDGVDPHNHFLASERFNHFKQVEGAPYLGKNGPRGGQFVHAEVTDIVGPKKLYRVQTEPAPGEDAKNGGWWSEDPPPETLDEWRQRDAVIPEWTADSDANMVQTINIPEGQKITAWKGPGAAANQDGVTYNGGANQLKIDPAAVDNSWYEHGGKPPWEQ